MVSDDILVDDSEITTNTHIWGCCFGSDCDVGCYRRCRRDEKIGTETVEFFLGDFKDSRRDFSRSRLQTGRQMLGEFNVY